MTSRKPEANTRTRTEEASLLLSKEDSKGSPAPGPPPHSEEVTGVAAGATLATGQAQASVAASSVVRCEWCGEEISRLAEAARQQHVASCASLAAALQQQHTPPLGGMTSQTPNAGRCRAPLSVPLHDAASASRRVREALRLCVHGETRKEL